MEILDKQYKRTRDLEDELWHMYNYSKVEDVASKAYERFKKIYELNQRYEVLNKMKEELEAVVANLNEECESMVKEFEDWFKNEERIVEERRARWEEEAKLYWNKDKMRLDH